MESLNEIQPDLKCDKCYCKNIAVVKKGFSGSNSVIGYLAGSLIAGFIWAATSNISGLSLNPVALASLCLPFLGLFAGTLKMNDIYSVCLRCAHKTLLQTDEEKNATPWFESASERD